MADFALHWGGGELLLCPERAAFWVEKRVLLVADFHLGKAHSFRRLGVPVPGGTSEANLMRLGALVQRLAAAEVVFLGDFLHSARSRGGPGIDAFAAWSALRKDLALTLVRGNHDRQAGDPPTELGIAVVDEPLRRGPWSLCHHPSPRPGQASVAGHLHPGATLGGRTFDRLRLPAFHARENVLVLPAFGEFTGLATVRRQPDDLCFVTDGLTVRRLP
ncbi:ligase-associated DNA damage response endonuclease PdeM [Ideonella sp. YS5]|uniref:ligase-associated DNA damage response endonuclease PdeM n=1 Tax=Ideonella sp. YS5 TaxID=3453714 RepID=UPI003EEB1237